MELNRFEGRFIGRTAELHTFENMLDNTTDKPWALFIQGPGGIGKTWLIRKMLETAQRTDFLAPDQLVDMYSTDNRHIEGVMDTIVRNLRPIGAYAFTEYDAAKADLECARAIKEFSQEGIDEKLDALEQSFHSTLKRISQETPIVVAFDTFEHVQDGPVGNWILSDGGLLMPGVLCLVASRNPSKSIEPTGAIEDLQLANFSDEEAADLYYGYTSSEEEKTPELEDYINKINDLAEGNPLLLGLAIYWLNLPDMSPERLDQLTQEQFERAIVSWLDPIEGSGSFLVSQAELDEPMRQTLVCMSYLNRRFNRFFLERLVAQGYIRPGIVTVDQIWRQLELKKPDFFFVKERPEGEVQLHDRLAEMLRLYLLPNAFDDITGDRLRLFAQDVLTWYDKLLQSVDSQVSKEVLQAEKLAYVLQLDVLSDFRLRDLQGVTLYPLQPDFEQAGDLLEKYKRVPSSVLDRLIIGEIQPDVVELFPLSEQHKIYAILGEIATRAYRLEQAGTYWKRAFEAAKQTGNREQQVAALVGQHNSTWQTEPQASLEILHQALEICDQVDDLRPRVLYEIGFAHRRMENLEEAIDWYKQAQDLAALHQDKIMMPTILNDMGFVHLLVGDYNKAETLIRTASRLRQRDLDIVHQRIADAEKPELGEALASQAHDAALKLGMTYNTLGQMARYKGDMTTATADYSEALSIFKNAGSYIWQARALYSRGEAHRRIAMTLYDLGRTDSSQDYDRRAEEDIEASLELCDRYGFIHELDTANRRMGRLLHDRGAFRTEDDPDKQIELLGQALQHFEAALQIAQDTGDVLEELECLTEIAFLADDRMTILSRHYPEIARAEEKDLSDYIERLRQGIERHRDDEPRIYQFSVFENLLSIEEGAFYYALGNYDRALEHYVQGYVGMAQDPGYGSARYRQHLDHLLESIRRLGDPEREKEWCERFVNVWQTTRMQRVDPPQTLADAHRELLDEIELHLKTAFIYR